MYDFIGKEITYPANARRIGVQGKVYVEFVVEPDGSLTNFAIFKGVHIDLDAEIIRIFKKYGSLYKWNPGTQKGVPVRQKMVVPFTFKLG